MNNFRKNSLGTLAFDFQIQGMRKSQNFVTYPLAKDQKRITIQSDTRIGQIDLETGRGCMSRSHAGGAFFVHLAMDTLVRFELSATELQEFKNQLALTSSKGTDIVEVENEGVLQLS